VKIKKIKVILLIVIISIVTFFLFFKIVNVRPNKIGMVFSLWNGKIFNYLSPGKHVLFRLDGFRNVSRSVHPDYLKINAKTYIIYNEPLHGAAEIDLYKKYSWEYFVPLINSRNIQRKIDPNGDAAKTLERILKTDTVTSKYIHVVAVTALE